MTTLYKLRDGDLLIVTGHLSKQEVKDLIRQGYRHREPQINRHGIPVGSR